MAELPEIFAQIVVIQEGITPPTDEKGVTVYGEPPATSIVYPSFINIADVTETIEHGESWRRTPYIIDMHLIFAQSMDKYSHRSKLTWVKPVRDAFAAKTTLNGTVMGAYILDMDFHKDGLTLRNADSEYEAITFTLHATVKEAVAFGT